MGAEIASPPSAARHDTQNQVSLMLATEPFESKNFHGLGYRLSPSPFPEKGMRRKRRQSAGEGCLKRQTGQEHGRIRSSQRIWRFGHQKSQKETGDWPISF
jgi:hypothetical protein